MQPKCPLCGSIKTTLLITSEESEGWDGAPPKWEEWYCIPCEMPFCVEIK